MPTKKKREPKITKLDEKISIEIKLKVLDIMKSNIDWMMWTINKIDSKVWILVGFYFLVFIEIVKYLESHRILFLSIYIILFSLSIYFLIKNFRLKNVKNLYPNLSTYIPYKEKLDYEWYIDELWSQYMKIKENLNDSIRDRISDLRISIVLFCISISIFISVVLLNSSLVKIILYYNY